MVSVAFSAMAVDDPIVRFPSRATRVFLGHYGDTDAPAAIALQKR